MRDLVNNNNTKLKSSIHHFFTSKKNALEMARHTEASESRRSRSRLRMSPASSLSPNKKASPKKKSTQRGEDEVDELAPSSDKSRGNDVIMNAVEEDDEEDEDDENADKTSNSYHLHQMMFGPDYRLRNRGPEEAQATFPQKPVTRSQVEPQFDPGDSDVFLDRLHKENKKSNSKNSNTAEKNAIQGSIKRSGRSSAAPRTHDTRTTLSSFVRSLVPQRRGAEEAEEEGEEEEGEEGEEEEEENVDVEDADEEHAVDASSDLQTNAVPAVEDEVPLAEDEGGEFEVYNDEEALEAQKRDHKERRRQRRERESSIRNGGRNLETRTPLFRTRRGEDSDELVEDSDEDEDDDNASVHTAAENNPSTKGYRYHVSGNGMGRTKWTDEETDCLLNALETIMTGNDKPAKLRPYYAILKDHGPKGSRDTILAGKNNLQLKDKVRNEILRRKRASLDIPDWLDSRFRTI